MNNKVKSNKRVVGVLSLCVVAMFAFGYALVPLYDVFCELTGLNGKGKNLSEVSQIRPLEVDKSRIVTVEFAVDVSGIPWRIDRPEKVRLQVHPGETVTVKYEAHNLVNNTTAGQAIPSVIPARAVRHFQKLECFCFVRQELGPLESRVMPVTFIVNPALPKEVKTITLSYSVYPQDLDVTQL